MNFVVASSEPWLGPLLSKHHVALELCRLGHRVLFMDRRLRAGSLLRGRLPSSPPFPQAYHRHADRNLRRLRPLWPPKSLGLERLAPLLVGLQVRLCGFRPDCVIAFAPRFGFLAGLWQVPFVYYAVDTQLREDEALVKADLVVAATTHLYERYRERHPRVVYIPHGVAPELFSRRAIPDDLPPPPRAGFLGAVNEHLDIALLTKVARRCPDISFVLLGPHESDDFGRGLTEAARKELSQHSNIHLLGPRPAEELGAYLGGFEVGLVPYDLGHRAVHFSLHKVLQYLAADLPVVTTVAPPDGLEVPSLFTARDVDGFEAGLREALASPPTTERLRFARSHTWADRVRQLLLAIYPGGAAEQP